MNTEPVLSTDLFVVNPDIDQKVIAEAADLRLGAAEALLAVHSPGLGGYVDFAEHDAPIEAAYLDAIRALVSDARLLSQEAWNRQRNQQKNKAR